MTDLLPIAWCEGCDVACGKDEFLIVVPSHWRGDIDIGRIEGYCERCYCAMGTGGRGNWERAMAPLSKGYWRSATTGWKEGPIDPSDHEPQNRVWPPPPDAYFHPHDLKVWWDPGPSPEFPDGTCIVYVDRPRIRVAMFNKHGRCVVAPTGPRPPKWWRPGR